MEEDDNLGGSNFDMELLRRCNLKTMFQEKKITIEIDVQKADEKIDEFFRSKAKTDILCGVRDLEHVNFYEIEYSNEKKEVTNQFADSYDLSDRVFYADSTTRISKNGKYKYRVKRVGEQLENDLIRSDAEMKMLQSSNAKLSESEKNFLEDIPRDIARAGNRINHAVQRGVSNSMHSAANSANNESSRGQIKRIVSESMKRCEKTKFGHGDAIVLKTVNEIVKFSKDSIKFDDHLLEGKLLRDVGKLTSGHPSKDWQVNEPSVLNVDDDEKRNKVKLSLEVQLDALQKSLETERQKKHEKARLHGENNKKYGRHIVSSGINLNRKSIISDAGTEDASPDDKPSTPAALHACASVSGTPSVDRTNINNAVSVSPRPPKNPAPSKQQRPTPSTPTVTSSSLSDSRSTTKEIIPSQSTIPNMNMTDDINKATKLESSIIKSESIAKDEHFDTISSLKNEKLNRKLQFVSNSFGNFGLYKNVECEADDKLVQSNVVISTGNDADSISVYENNNDDSSGMINNKKNYKNDVDIAENSCLSAAEPGKMEEAAHFLPAFDDDSVAKSTQYFCFPIKVVNRKQTEGSVSTTPSSKPYTYKELSKKIEASSRKVSKATDNDKICKDMSKAIRDPSSFSLSDDLIKSNGVNTFTEYATNAVLSAKQENEAIKDKVKSVLKRFAASSSSLADTCSSIIDNKIHFEEAQLKSFEERSFFQSDKIAETFKTLVEKEERDIIAEKSPTKKHESKNNTSANRVDCTSEISYSESAIDGCSTFLTDMKKEETPSRSLTSPGSINSNAISEANKKIENSSNRNLTDNIIDMPDVKPVIESNVKNRDWLDKALPTASNIQMFMSAKIKHFERTVQAQEDGLLLSNKWFLILVTRIKSNMIKQRKVECEPCLINILSVVKKLIIRKVKFTKAIVMDLIESLIPKDKFKLNIVYCVLITLCYVVHIDKDSFYKYLLSKNLPIPPILDGEMNRKVKFLEWKAAQGTAKPNSNSSSMKCEGGGTVLKEEFVSFEDDFGVAWGSEHQGFLTLEESLNCSAHDLNLFQEEVWLKL